MKTEQKLARAFKTLAEQGEQIDSTASSVLSIVKGAGAVNEEKFDELVAAAYAANKWNAQVGRPANGAPVLEAAPSTVRTYVTIMRRAIRVGLRIGRYDTFNALRTALERKSQPRLVRAGKKGRKGRAAPAVSQITLDTGVERAQIPAPVQNDFVGVAIENPSTPNGALFHDLGTTFINLPEGERAELGRELSMLLHKYLPLVKVQSLAVARTKRGRGNGHGARKAA